MAFSLENAGAAAGPHTLRQPDILFVISIKTGSGGPKGFRSPRSQYVRTRILTWNMPVFDSGSLKTQDRILYQ